MTVRRASFEILSRVCVWIALGVTTVAHAGAQITSLGEPDKYGATNYSVKCDSGARKIVQCIRDDLHCGYAGDQALASMVESLCSGAAIEPPQSDAPPMETAPASP